MPAAADPKSDNYYTVLGLDKGASDKEITKAYRVAALKWHPDKNPDDKDNASNMFKNVTEAYEVLHDADKRKTYDIFGKLGLERGAGGSGGGSFQHADDIFKAFFGGSDPFSMFFGEDAEGFGGMPGGMGGFGKGGPNVSFNGGANPFGMGKGGMMFGGMGPGKGNGKGTQEQPLPDWAIPKGTQVIVRGLKSSAEHNGRQGSITGWVAEKGRYEVECDNETSLSLKPANLTQMASVEITGIGSQKELNGQKATVAGYNDESGRYALRLSAKMSNGKDVVGLQPGSVFLGRWTRVVVIGLTNATFNGQMAQIIDVDRDTNKYTVACQNGKQIKIKIENVLC